MSDNVIPFPEPEPDATVNGFTMYCAACKKENTRPASAGGSSVCECGGTIFVSNPDMTVTWSGAS